MKGEHHKAWTETRAHNAGVLNGLLLSNDTVFGRSTSSFYNKKLLNSTSRTSQATPLCLGVQFSLETLFCLVHSFLTVGHSYILYITIQHQNH